LWYRLITSSINAYKLYEEHHEHQKHHPKEWVRYPYLNLRAKDFFWGKESLFFNPETNLSASEE
jgi:cytochrome c oxidase subunit 6a